MTRLPAVLVPLSLLTSTPALAKSICVEETDPFTKTTSIVANGGPTLEVTASDEGQIARINVTIDKAVSEDLPAGFALQLLLEDGVLVELVAPEATVGGSQVSSYGVYTLFPVQFDVSAEHLQQLGSSPVTHIRYSMLGQEVNTEMPGRFSKKFLAAFGCVAEARG